MTEALWHYYVYSGIGTI